MTEAQVKERLETIRRAIRDNPVEHARYATGMHRALALVETALLPPLPDVPEDTRCLVWAALVLNGLPEHLWGEPWNMDMVVAEAYALEDDDPQVRAIRHRYGTIIARLAGAIPDMAEEELRRSWQEWQPLVGTDDGYSDWPESASPPDLQDPESQSRGTVLGGQGVLAVEGLPDGKTYKVDLCNVQAPSFEDALASAGDPAPTLTVTFAGLHVEGERAVMVDLCDALRISSTEKELSHAVNDLMVALEVEFYPQDFEGPGPSTAP